MKLMLSDIANYGDKCEEIIWRKCFYEPIQAARQRLKVSCLIMLSHVSPNRRHIPSTPLIILRIVWRFISPVVLDSIIISWLDYTATTTTLMRGHKYGIPRNSPLSQVRYSAFSHKSDRNGDFKSNTRRGCVG